jgi:hypothetical protein
MSQHGNPPTPTGWYPDHNDPTIMRYWDDTGWTAHTAPAGAQPVASRVDPPKTLTKMIVKWTAIGVGVLVALFFLLIALVLIFGGGSPDNKKPVAQPPAISTSTETAEATATATPGRESKQTASATPRPEATKQLVVEAPIVVAPAGPATPDVDPEYFRTNSNNNIADILVDLDDLIVAVDEAGAWRIMGNTVELSFNVGQLESTEAPAALTGESTAAVAALDATATAISVSSQDYAAIRVHVDEARRLLAALTAIVARA